MANKQPTNCTKIVSEEIPNEAVVSSKLSEIQPAENCPTLEKLSNGFLHTAQEIVNHNLLPLRNDNCLSTKLPDKIFTNNTEDSKPPTSIECPIDTHATPKTTSTIKHSHSQTPVPGLTNTFSSTTWDHFTARQNVNTSSVSVANCHSKQLCSVDKNSTTIATSTTNATGLNVTASTSTPEYGPERVSYLNAATEEDLSCGFGSCKPSCIQIFNTPTAILVFLCVANFVKGFIMNGVINVNMSTIEKRFGLTSSQAGWIASIHDITAAPVALVVSFIGSVGYKMRWLGFSLFSLSVGSFIMTIPHFAADNYNWRPNVTGLCSNTSDIATDDSPDNNSSQFLYVFLVGQLFHGIGSSILHTLGISCIDDCIKPKNAPMCMGVMLCFGTLGPAVGFLIGGQFLNVYVDINNTDQMPADTDPQWVGAWWISFLISGTITSLIAPIMFTYARELPVTKEIRSTRKSEVHENASQQKLAQSGFGTTIKDLPMTMYLLLWNPSFLFVTFTFTTEAALLDGISTFLPKFLESQYRQSPSKASLITGCIAVPGATGGQFIGGYVCKKFDLKITEMTKLALAGFVVSLLTWGVVWVGCDKHSMAGVSHNYQEHSYSLKPPTPDLVSSCNKDCSCNTEYYQPVCGSNGNTYFSPCHAGCLNFEPEIKVYSNCSCVTNDDIGTAKDGVCHGGEHCYQMFIFLPFLLITLFATFLARTPLLAVVLRCIPDNQRTFGLGMNHFIRRLLGSLPGPLLFGKALDRACKIWKQDEDDESSCWLYDSFELSMNFFLLFVVLRLFSILFLILANYLYKPPSKQTTVVHVYDNIAMSRNDEITYM